MADDNGYGIGDFFRGDAFWGFGAGFLGGMAAGAQITGPVPPSGPLDAWRLWFIVGCAVAGGIFGGVAGALHGRRFPVKLPPTDN